MSCGSGTKCDGSCDCSTARTLKILEQEISKLEDDNGRLLREKAGLRDKIHEFAMVIGELQQEVNDLEEKQQELLLKIEEKTE